jgi:cobaltochelatase CobS
VVNDVPKPDPFYVLNKHITYAFVAGDDEHVFLVGMPGCGKTTLPYQVAAITGRPVFKQSFQNDLESDEWIMSKEIDDTGTHWSTLPFVESLEYPYYAVLDEFNRLRRGGRLLMNRLLDKGGSMQLRDGREVWPHSQWRAVATDNTRGMGDGLDKFDGDVADISTTDRFGLMVEVPYLPQEDQVKLATNWFPQMNEEMAKEIVQFGEKVIAGYKVGTFPLPWTPRRMEKACKLALRYRNPTAGLRDAYFNFLAEDDERKACNQCLKDVGLATKYGNFGD